MAKILGLLPAAINAVKAGWNASRFIKWLKQEGLGARQSEVRQLFKQAQAIVNKSTTEPFADIGNVPSGSELAPWPVKTETGVMQTVTLVYRDRTTGTIVTTYYSVTSPTGVTRADAIAQAIGAYSDNAERYKQDLIGAVHTGAYQKIPMETS